MAYQTIFFDLDGTLIDPKGSITKSVQYALSQFSIEADQKELLPFIGPPLDISFEKYYGLTGEKAVQAVAYYREYFSKHGIKEAEAYEGAEVLLKKLKTKDKILCVVTSKFHTFAKELITKHKLNDYFDNIIATSDKANEDANKSSLVKRALSLYPEASKGSFIMIGDREHDIIGARTNGIDSIAVTYGYGSEKELQNSNPTHLVNTIEELENLLTNTH